MGKFLVALLLFLLGSDWVSGTRFTVIDTKGGVVVESVEPRLGERLRMKLPENMEVETADGEGKWLAGKMGEAGKPEWATSIVAKYLGIACVGEKSRLKLGDRLVWWWLTKGKEVKELDMEKRGWLVEKKAPDGLVLTKLSPRWETVTRELFSSPAVIDEGITVAVTNFTGKDGYGNFAARIVENMGMRVGMVKTGDDQQEIDGCVVKSSKVGRKSLSVRLVIKQFNCKWQEGRGDGEAEIDLGR